MSELAGRDVPAPSGRFDWGPGSRVRTRARRGSYAGVPHRPQRNGSSIARRTWLGRYARNSDMFPSGIVAHHSPSRNTRLRTRQSVTAERWQSLVECGGLESLASKSSDTPSRSIQEGPRTMRSPSGSKRYGLVIQFSAASTASRTAWLTAPVPPRYFTSPISSFTEVSFA